ncbi:-mRNA 3'-end-processing protein RNA14 [Babesia bigemina]|uniref:-mRNA 3'-end-processing protein RNA14 n=1 Tax=Babesia bigemina TaxID=5866 RepID=A0A061DDX8_BABBI|nr:-mRNA 3'-end-processing protein RNA14 [Babesia bigemina]CDR97774.1 -mRNA 3'-end-processing protein RNA14 [Babesia bigemina]|eukprot:XP_012769960.1 -mRNA 3'-end-processing protein RNA14 [Babesia bigemina]
MEEQGKPQPARVVTANKLLHSVLHGSSPLLPPMLNGVKPKNEPGKAVLLESIEDDQVWFTYIKASKDGGLLEEACRVFPNYWKAHHRCALYHVYHKQTRKAFDAYVSAMKEMDDYDLYICYLKFLYCMASVHEYIAGLFTAVDKVGMDLRSDPLWRELIVVLVKIYNCNLMDHNVHTGLLPNLFPPDSETVSVSIPLYPSETEQVVFRGVNSLDKGEQTYVQLYGDVNHIRKMFHRWLRSPTNNLKQALDGYSAFENIASAANVLCTKLLSEAKTTYETSVAVYEKLSGMYRNVLPAQPARRRQLNAEQTAEQQRQVGFWTEIIKYEESNPLGLPASELAARVLFTLRGALSPHIFSDSLWYMYFQFLLANDRREKAVETLRYAIRNYLQDDGKMQFVLAAYLDDGGESAATEFGRLIDPGLRLVEDGETGADETQLRHILRFDASDSSTAVQPARLIHYLNYVRRNLGRVKWHEDLQVILTKRELLSWELYWYAADTEVRCFGDVDAAAAFLSEAQQSLPFDMHYTMLHLRFLLNMGRLVDARVLLTQLVVGANVAGETKCKPTASDKIALWHFWLHTEYFYGTKAQFTQVRSLFVQFRVASEVGLDVFAEKSHRNGVSTIRQIFGNIGPSFIKAHMDSSKRVATADMHAVVELRKHLFCVGLEYDDLDRVFFFATRRPEVAVEKAASSEKEAEKYISPSNFAHRSEPDQDSTRRHVFITRPDVAALAPLDPHNVIPVESMITLHGGKRPPLPDAAKPMDTVATPPKVLFDLLRVLPNPNPRGPFPKMYGNAEAIDHLIRSLECAGLKDVQLLDYQPIPVNQLLHLKKVGASDSQNIEESVESAAKEGAFELNNGLFSILRFVEGHVGADEASRLRAKRASKKQKLAI